MMRSHFLSVISSGFSTITCLPALAAATAGSMCRPLGVAIVTTSTCGSASISSSEWYALQPFAAANRSAASARVSQQADELRAAHVGNRPRVKLADHAAADDAETECHEVPFDW